MKSILIILLLGSFPLYCQAQWHSIARDRLSVLNNSPAARAAQAQSAYAARQSEAAAREQLEWQRSHPWWIRQDWRNATNNISVLGNLVVKNQQELSLLEGAAQGGSSRAKQLSMWIRNEQKALSLAEGVRIKIEGQFNLDQYYRTNHF